MGTEREEVRLLRLRPHRPPGQRGEAGREVGAGGLKRSVGGGYGVPEPERKDVGHTKN